MSSWYKWGGTGSVTDGKLEATVTMTIAGSKFTGEGSHKVLNTNILPSSHKAQTVSQHRARNVSFAYYVWGSAVKNAALQGGIVAWKVG